jgi:hypothetical protein
MILVVLASEPNYKDGVWSANGFTVLVPREDKRSPGVNADERNGRQLPSLELSSRS